MFSFFRKKEPKKSYDREKLRPVILCSICTGEETAGFRETDTGKFHGDRLLRSRQDLKDFMEEYGISQEPPREY